MVRSSFEEHMECECVCESDGKSLDLLNILNLTIAWLVLAASLLQAGGLSLSPVAEMDTWFFLSLGVFSATDTICTSKRKSRRASTKRLRRMEFGPKAPNAFLHESLQRRSRLLGIRPSYSDDAEII